MSGVIIQFFHWYHPGNIWEEFEVKADYLKKIGFDAVWFPPATKCSKGSEGRGYDVYDAYDLGEFDQRGGIPTRYGTKEQYLRAISKARHSGISVYADVVLNHRIGGDESESIWVHQVNEDNRNKVISEVMKVNAYTKFTFPGRKNKYSDFIWDYHCFSGIDIAEKNGEEIKGIFKIHNEYGTKWNDEVIDQFGNYDFLMGADIEYRNPSVVQEMKSWIRWYLQTTHADGLRLDALKHISFGFLKEWISYIKKEINPEFNFIGEFWKDNAEMIAQFSDEMNGMISYFDVPLHYNFFNASQDGEAYDLRKIFEGSFLEKKPSSAITFVENHDTQPLQSLESAVRDWFKPIAYALILLIENGRPCVFYPDLFGAEYTDTKDNNEAHIVIPKLHLLPVLMEARKKFAYGSQINFFDHQNCIAFMRTGIGKDDGCLVIISNSKTCSKEVGWGKEYANATFYDFLHQRIEEIVLDDEGEGTFTVNAQSISVWVLKDQII